MALPQHPAAAQLLRTRNWPHPICCMAHAQLRGFLEVSFCTEQLRILQALPSPFVHPICGRIQLLPCPTSLAANCQICLQPAQDIWGLVPLVPASHLTGVTSHEKARWSYCCSSGNSLSYPTQAPTAVERMCSGAGGAVGSPHLWLHPASVWVLLLPSLGTVCQP